jgi:ferric-dicitrate binding protein FerR (iron transport regulator)
MNFLRRNTHFMGILVCVALFPLAIVLERREHDFTTLVTAYMPNTRIRLPDGSWATMASGTMMRFRRDMAARRTMWLFGAADLEVVKGGAFTVWTETAVVRTDGGDFSVTALTPASTLLAVHKGTATLRALNEDDDPAYPSMVVGAGQRALAARTVGTKLLPTSEDQSDRSATIGSTRVARRAGK